MRRKAALVATTLVILVSFLLAGCQSGISQEQYDAIAAQLNKAKEQLTEVQDEAQDYLAEKEAIVDEVEAAQEKVAELQGQVNALKESVSGLAEQYELVGATKAETAEKIVRYYHETHVYSTYDLFVCGDMASEVWNMLKAQGIDAVIVVGNKDTAISNILESNHAWVLAEVAPGENLALETTAGQVIPRSKNPLYYRGWSFNSPGELKKHNALVREYNVRVGIHNDIVDEANKVINEYNQATSQNTADKLEAVYQKLTELIEAQEAEMTDIKAELDSLATMCSG
jgi:predicted nuclease with TOPRIM domain